MMSARLCSAAAAGQILIDAETQAKTASQGAFDILEPLSLKGFAQPVPAFRIASLASTDS